VSRRHRSHYSSWHPDCPSWVSHPSHQNSSWVDRDQSLRMRSHPILQQRSAYIRRYILRPCTCVMVGSPIPVTDETTDFSMYWYFSCHTLTRISQWNSRSDRDTDYAWVGDSHPLLHKRYSEDTLYKNAKSQNQKLKKAPTTIEAIKIQIPNTYKAERRLEEAPIPLLEKASR
jgi:hypothetical protein